MDRWTVGMDGQMDRWNGRMDSRDGWTDGQGDGRMDRWTGELMDGQMDRWTGGRMDRWMKEWPGRWTNGHKLELILAEAVPQEPYGCRSPFGCFFLRILGVPELLMAAPVAPHPSQVKVSSSTPNKGIFLRGVNWVEK